MRRPIQVTGQPMHRRWVIAMMVALAPTLVAFRANAADPAPPSGVPSEAEIPAFALTWFTDMQAGRFNRAQYAPAYAAQLTDDAVAEMSKALNQYGAAPVRAEMLGKRNTADQTFYEVKLIFPRGNSSSLLFGFGTDGKITGVAVKSLPGD